MVLQPPNPNHNPYDCQLSQGVQAFHVQVVSQTVIWILLGPNPNPTVQWNLRKTNHSSPSNILGLGLGLVRVIGLRLL